MLRIHHPAFGVGAAVIVLVLGGCAPPGTTADRGGSAEQRDGEAAADAGAPQIEETAFRDDGDGAAAASASPAADDAPTTQPPGEPTVAESAAEASVYKKPAIDPVVANGPIFVEWPKPQLAIMISGELDGYLEPCGFAGLENQLGGLKRRHTLIKELEGQGWPLVRLDLGGLTKRLGPQTEIKYRYALESLVEIGYAAVALGAGELKLNVDAVAGALSNLDPTKNPAVAANVGLYGLEESASLGLTAPYRVIEAGGKRIGVTAVLGAKQCATLKNIADVAAVDPAAGLAKAAQHLAAAKVDYQVLLVHGDPAEAAALSQKFPQFQFVVTAGGAEEPPKSPKPLPSGATLIESGHKGMYVIVLGFYDDFDQSVRYQRVPLDARFTDSKEMQAKLTAYQQELETMALAGLGLTGNAHPDGDFIGSETCAQCHTKAWEVFANTPHHHATDTLVKLDPPRQFDPECLSCHVTGWNPQEYFPYSTGYFGLDSTPALAQQGCENCHGPGKSHAEAELGDVVATDQEKETLRAALRMKIVDNEGNKDGQAYAEGSVVENCMRCHDVDNSPDFNFQEYWPLVEHKGKD